MVSMRIGQGFDIHRFGPGTAVVLGGVEIPHTAGLVGHSDADVVCHAVMDALLGALALGDIGHLFPDTDARWKGACSMDLLRRVVARVAERGYRVVNVDLTVLAERPKIAPHVELMRANLANALQVASTEVSVKATTLETLGALGRREGLAVMAVALLDRTEERDRHS